ncbi:MAG: hypothetical protein ACRC2T_04610, partial [Thermoguttaceae bacterium]
AIFASMRSCSGLLAVCCEISETISHYITSAGLVSIRVFNDFSWKVQILVNLANYTILFHRNSNLQAVNRPS